jgi:hypothetical protein
MTDAPAPLFSGARQYEHFCRMSDFYSSKAMRASSSPKTFPVGAPMTLPKDYMFAGQRRSLAELIEQTDTSALLVIQNGQIRFESYYLTGGERVRWVSWSVAKSFISALVGIAIEQGAIRSIEDAISDYWPDMKGSAYEGVDIRHVLQMSSGARWMRITVIRSLTSINWALYCQESRHLMSWYAGYLLSRRQVPFADITRRIPKHLACCSAGLRVSLCWIICLGTYLSLWVWKTHFFGSPINQGSKWFSEG